MFLMLGKTIFVLQNDLKKDSREIKDISILMGFVGSKCKVKIDFESMVFKKLSILLSRLFFWFCLF